VHRPELAVALAVAVLLPLTVASRRAEARDFVRSYTPYLDHAGESEIEAWTTARSGLEEDSETVWNHRLELEHAFADRLTAAGYLNFSQPETRGQRLHLDGVSLEMIGALAERGRVPLDPALYLELTRNGDETEIEPKLLLGLRRGRTICAVNLIGEFHAGSDTDEEVSRSFEFSAGVSRQTFPRMALGLEGGYRWEPVAAGRDHAVISVGPTASLRLLAIALTVGWQPQLWGSPATSGHLDTEDFERSEVRAVLSLEL